MTTLGADGVTTGSCAVALSHVSVAFGDTLALRDVSCSVEWGERVLLMGPNGAGKTTLLRLLAGLLRPTRGVVQVAGHSPFDLETRRRVGVMLHNPWLDPDLTARETLTFFARLYGVTNAEHRIVELLDTLRMTSRAEQPARALSRGYQQRLSLARALLHAPGLLILDEPDTGLDDASREIVGAMLRSPAHGSMTVILSSHNQEFGRSVASRALALEGGRISSAATTDVRRPVVAG